MRLLLPALCLMSFSSCFAVLGIGALAMANSGNAEAHRRQGAEREARLKAEAARDAAVIRQRYNEAMREPSSPSPVLLLEPRPSLVPSAPPLVSLEPARAPLRPR